MNSNPSIKICLKILKSPFLASPLTLLAESNPPKLRPLLGRTLLSSLALVSLFCVYFLTSFSLWKLACFIAFTSVRDITRKFKRWKKKLHSCLLIRWWLCGRGNGDLYTFLKKSGSYEGFLVMQNLAQSCGLESLYYTNITIWFHQQFAYTRKIKEILLHFLRACSVARKLKETFPSLQH